MKKKKDKSLGPVISKNGTRVGELEEVILPGDTSEEQFNRLKAYIDDLAIQALLGTEYLPLPDDNPSDPSA